MPKQITAFAALACALIAGCGDHHGRDLTVGKDKPDTATAGRGRAGDEAARAGRSGASAVPIGGSGALEADIQNREGVALDVVTVACAGECFEVVAVARGGYPPYTYRWEDGSTSAVRKLCPESSQPFEVTATDHGYESEEFKRAAETVTASVNAEVLACPDAGAPDAATPPPADAGTPDAGPEMFKWEPLCIPNGSFDDGGGSQWWRLCPPSIAPGLTITGEAGNYYLLMEPAPGRPDTVSVRLCEPVKAGTGYYWTQALARDPASGPVLVEFFFSNVECGLDGKLYDSTPQTTWSRVCSTWPAAWDAQWLTIRAVATGNARASVFVDELLDISPVCPAPTL